MSGSKLDQLVKGAPPPGTSVPTVLSRSPTPVLPAEPAESTGPRSTALLQPSDLLATLPSSPPQIYLNLLILEASLRSQYLTLRARRRQNTFFLFLLTIWIVCFFYALFLRPREDGSGVGGSVYWVVEMAEKVALMGGVVTAILVWGTGQWDRGVRWPRRWVGVANRGLRNVNAKIVVIKGPWWKEMLGHVSFLSPYSFWFPIHGASYQHVDHSVVKASAFSTRSGSEEAEEISHLEDLSPGGDYIKLLLLPKPFSPEFRENWELYRLEYWEKENERRAQLSERLKKRQRQLARDQSGWLWWTGWRGWKKAKDTGARGADIEKSHRRLLERDNKIRHSIARSESHSRTTSRSSTPTNPDAEDRPLLARVRRGSSNSTNERLKKAKSSLSSDGGHISKLTSTKKSSEPPVSLDNQSLPSF